MYFKFKYKDGFEKTCSEQEAIILEKLKRGSIVRNTVKPVSDEYTAPVDLDKPGVKRGRPKKADV